MNINKLRFAAILIIFSMGGMVPSQAHAEPIRIGVSVPLTGTTANWGKDILNAIEFANSKLGKGAYELVIEDDKCDPKEAVTVARKLSDLGNIKYVIGIACSGPMLAAAPIYEKAKVLTIASAASAAKISKSGDFIFRTWPSDEVGVKTLTSFIGKRHKRLGVLSEQTEYAQGLLEGIKANKDKLEIFSEEYAPGTNDFRTLLLRMKKHNVDAIFLNPQGDSTLLPMLNQLKQLNISLPKYSMYFGASETVRGLGGDLTEDLIFADVPEVDAIATEEGKSLISEFTSKYKIHFSPMVVLSAFEGLRAIDSAIKSGQDVRKFLYATTFFGSFGKWSFDANGDIVGVPFVMKRIVNKQLLTF